MFHFLKSSAVAVVALLSTAQMSAADGYVLRGIISSASTPEVPVCGIYHLPTSDGGAYESVFTDYDIFSGAFSGYENDGKYYLHTNSRERGSTYIISLASGQYEQWRSSGYTPLDISADASSNTVYGLLVMDYDVPYLDERCFRFGTVAYSDRGASTDVLSYLEGKFNAMAVASGTVYAIKTIESNGMATGAELCTIDKQTGETTKLYDLDAVPSAQGSATVHPGTGELYWMVNSEGGDPAKLYKINLSSGKMQLVHTYYDCYTITGIEFVKPAAMDIPGVVTDLSATFSNGSRTGTVSFKAPATKLDGTVGGNLTYTITDADTGSVLKSGTCAYGQEVSVEITVAEDKTYTLAVAVSEGDKTGDAVKTTLYIGKDTPITPVITKTQYNDDKTVVLEWRKADAGVHGGYVDPEDITYTVVRYPDATTILSEKGKTSVSDVLPDPDNFTVYYYGVTADYAGKKSDERISDKYFCGIITPPYEHSFKTADDMLGYTTYCGNNSFYKWEFDSWSGAVCVGGDNSVEMDQWLFTPEINFEAEKNYLVEIHGHTNGSREEKYEIHFGNEPTKEGMTNLGGSAILTSNSGYNPDVASFWLTPEKDGIYHIAIRGVSPIGFGRLYIDKITIYDQIHKDAPGDFSNIEIEREIHGDFSATISFNAPDKTFAGGKLDKISLVTVTRDRKTVKEFTDVTPGQRLTFTDNTLEAAGDYIYNFQATNDLGRGKVTKSEPTFIGMLKPGSTAWVTVEEISNGEVKLTWAPITEDVNGVEIDPSRVRYHISSPTSDKSFYFDNYDGTSVTFKALEDNVTSRFMRFRIVGVTDSGWGPVVNYSPTITVGKPQTEFAESFPGGVFSTNPLASMISCYVNGNAYWLTDRDTDEIKAQDNDGGYAMMIAEEVGASSGFCTLKLILPEKNPAMSFWVYSFNDGGRVNNNIVAVDVLDREEVSDKPEQERWVEVFSKEVHQIAKYGEWGECVADLRPYAGKEVQLRIRGVGNNYMITVVDNIVMKEGEFSSISSVGAADVTVTAEGGTIIIGGATGLPTTVCTVDGRMVYNDCPDSDHLSIDANTGIYIVRIADKTRKIMVK